WRNGNLRAFSSRVRRRLALRSIECAAAVFVSASNHSALPEGVTTIPYRDIVLLHPLPLSKSFPGRKSLFVSRRSYEGASGVRPRRIVAEKLVGDAPGDATRHGQLGVILAGMGLKEEAINEGRKAVELLPESEDAFDGPQTTAALAEIYTWVGEHDEAFRLIDHLLQVPSGLTVHVLRLDPVWDPLRKDARFQALIEKYAATR